MPGVQSMVDGLSGSALGGDKGGKGASSSGEATQKAEMSVNLEFWAELTKTLESLLAGEGSVTVSPSSGTVAVTALPSKMRVISRFLQEENRRLSRQAAITVEIWSVSLNDSDHYGTDLRAVFKERQGLTYALEGARIFADENAGSKGVTVLHPAARTKLHRFDGSKLAFEALSAVGKVTRKARIPVTVLNNRPATRKIAIDTAYLESVSTTMAQDGVSQNALNPFFLWSVQGLSFSFYQEFWMTGGSSCNIPCICPNSSGCRVLAPMNTAFSCRSRRNVFLSSSLPYETVQPLSCQGLNRISSA